MVALLFIGGLFFLIIVPIIAIAAALRAGALRGDVNRLEFTVNTLQRRITDLEKAQPSQPAPAARSPIPVVPPVVAAPPPPVVEEPKPEPVAAPTPPEPELVAAPIEPEPVREPDAMATPEPVIIPEPAVAPEPVVEPEPIVASELPVTPEPVVAPEPVSEPEPEPEPAREPVTEPELAMVAKEILATMPAATPRQATKAAPRKFNFEQLLGGSVFIWIGAVMLALAGAFLVKYSIDVGLLSPAVRVALGLLLGAVLLGGGQWLRKDSPAISQALAAAAVADWFASLFAATALYDLVSPTFGFVCLAIVTAIGIGLALREGPFVGLVGIAGGFITPAIVSSDTPQPLALFVYLFFIQLGTLVLQHKRGWWYLTALGVGGGLAWALGWVALDQPVAGARLAQFSLPLFLLATDLAQLWSLHGKGGVKISREMMLTARSASILCFAIMAWWLVRGDYRLDDWSFLIALSLAHLAAARRFTSEEIPALAGAALVVVAYASWNPISTSWASLAAGSTMQDRSGALILIGLVLGVCYGLGGFALSYKAKNPTRWAGLSTLGTAGLLGGAYLNLHAQNPWASWFIPALALALLHAAAALLLEQLRQRERIYTGAVGLHCLAASGFLALAFSMQVQNEWLAVALALELPVMALVAWKLDLPWLRWGIWVGGAVVIAAVLLSGFPTGEWLIFNRLLYGIGIPCAGMIASALILRRMPDDRHGRLLVLMLQLAAAGLLALLIGLEIDHFIGRVDPGSGSNLVRAGSASTVWAAMAFGLFGLAQRTADRGVHSAAQIFTALSVIALVGGCFLAFNPLMGSVDIGRSWFFNRLLVAYALPALFLILLTERLRREPPPNGLVAAQSIMLLAFFTLFAWIGFSIRQGFHGSIITIGLVEGRVDGIEWYAYAAGWTLLLPLMAVVAAQRRYLWLRQAIWAVLLPILGAILASRLPVGAALIFNPPLLGIGVPMLGMFGTVWLLRRSFDDQQTRQLTAALTLIGGALLALLIWLQVDGIVERFAPDSGGNLLRAGGVATLWAALALALLWVHQRKPSADQSLRYGAQGFTTLSVLALVIGGFLFANPLFASIEVGETWVFNRLLIGYALPALFLMLVTERLRREPAPNGPVAAEALMLLAFFTLFVWIGLAIRQVFHGSILNLAVGPMDGIEWYAYAAGWTLLLPLMALVAAKRQYLQLRQAIWVAILPILGAILASRLPIGTWLVFNPPLFGIGIPMLGMIGTALLLERRFDDKATRQLTLALKLIGGALLALLIWLEIDGIVERFAPDSGGDLLRAGGAATVWAALGLALLRQNQRKPSSDGALRYGAQGFTILSALALVLGGFMFANPLIRPIEVGDIWVFNRLLVAYALPAGLLTLIAERLRHEPAPTGPAAAQGLMLLSVGTAFFWVAVTVRQIFNGSIIVAGPTNGVELYGYAAGWTLLLPVMAFTAAKRNFLWLRQAIWFGIAAILGAILVSQTPTGAWLFLNPPLMGVGVPMLGMIGTALMLERRFSDQAVKPLILALKLTGAGLLALLVWLELQQMVDFLVAGDTTLLRNGLVTIAWTGIAFALFRLERKRPWPDLAVPFAAYGFVGLSVALLVLGGYLHANPLWQPVDVGSVWVFNRLILVYAIPAVLMFLMAERLRRVPPPFGPMLALGAIGLALVTGFFWITLTVRQMAQGMVLNSGAVTDAEQYGYSAAWTLYGLFLLGLGTWRRSQMLRYASAGVILLTVSKVFLIDASDLTGLYRVASFLGLGLSLIGIGYLYQRLLFRQPK